MGPCSRQEPGKFCSKGRGSHRMAPEVEPSFVHSGSHLPTLVFGYQGHWVRVRRTHSGLAPIPSLVSHNSFLFVSYMGRTTFSADVLVKEDASRDHIRNSL